MDPVCTYRDEEIARERAEARAIERLEERMRYVPCDHCHGTGEIICRSAPRHAYDEPQDYSVLCSACDGYGMECVETEPAGIEHTEDQ